VDRPAAVQAVVEAAAGEADDLLVEVVHAERDAAAREVEHLVLGRLAAVLRGERERQRTGARHDEIRGLVLIAERVTADDDRLGPPGHEARHVLADDGLAEDRAADDVADRAVRRLPHLLEVELLHARFVGRDRRALDGDAVLLRRVRRIDRDLIVRLVAALDPEVEVLQVDLEVREDELVFDELPDDASHLVAVHLDDGVLHLDLRHGGELYHVILRRRRRRPTMTSAPKPPASPPCTAPPALQPEDASTSAIPPSSAGNSQGTRSTFRLLTLWIQDTTLSART